MKKLYTLVSLVLATVGFAQQQNYVNTTAYKQPTTTSNPSPAVSVANQNITFYDGLGRPIQQVASKQSGTGKNIVTPITYDAFGRQPKEYLPPATARIPSRGH